MSRTFEDISKNWVGDIEHPLVSISCITYNHDKFVTETIEGFLMQDTTFPFEIIIHDDASTDTTQKIIKDYAEKYPKLIKPILQTENLWLKKGISGTFTYAWPACKGKYIAWCEGDDYWIDKKKLQKQFDFLEHHANFYLCFTKAIRLNSNESEYSVYPETNQTEFAAKDFFYLPTIPMVSGVFRNSTNITITEKSVQLDFNLLCSLLSHGKAYMINEVTSVYRVHENSSTFRRSADCIKQRIEVLHKESEYSQYSNVVRKEIGRLYGLQIIQLLKMYPSEVTKIEKLRYLFTFLFIPKTTKENYLKSYLFILKSYFG